MPCFGFLINYTILSQFLGFASTINNSHHFLILEEISFQYWIITKKNYSTFHYTMKISKIRWVKNDSTADVKHSSNCTSSQPLETEVMVSQLNNKPMSHHICRHDSYNSGSLTWLPVKLPWVGWGHTFRNWQPWGIRILPAHNLRNLFTGICHLVNSGTEALRECQMYTMWCNRGQFLLKLWFRMSWATNITKNIARTSKAEQASSSVTMRQWHHALNRQQSGNKKYCLYIGH